MFDKSLNLKHGEESVIVLVGPIAAGKGTTAVLLIQLGYVPFNYGDIICIERTARKLKEERKNSNAVGAELRFKFGNDIIAKRIAEDIKEHRSKISTDKILIDGLRHPTEVLWLKEHLGARVIGITASQEVRYQRTIKRNRVVDPKSSKEFEEVDIEDRGVNAGGYENQSDACLLIADVVIENNGEDIEEYKNKFYETLANLNA
ncbi:MAG: AAA family ATPase [Candidatus Levyibacteriota bacterium]